MSSSDAYANTHATRIDRRRLLGGLSAAVLLVPLLGACADGSGFRPMYAAPAGGGPSLDQQLASIDYATIPGRVGQRLRNELMFQSTGGGVRGPIRYKVDIAITERVNSTLVNQQGNAASQIYSLDATYRLIDLSSKAVIVTGTSFGRASFERYTSIYSNVRAREDAENRVARSIAGEIKSRLAAVLSRRA